jgi:peptide/nickel transport system permease protein
MWKRKNTMTGEEIYTASQWQLIWWRFKRHKLAVLGMIILFILYTMAIFAEFFCTQDPFKEDKDRVFLSPTKIHFVDENGRFHIVPFVYGLKFERDPITWEKVYTEDKTKRYPIRLFVRGDKYRLWGIWESDIHLFGIDEPNILFLFGTDNLGRDLYSRIITASRISLSIGLAGVFLSFILGVILGGISGYYGGSADMIIQRVIDFLISLPTLPLWMALAAALPPNWSPVKTYFGITIILSLFAWCGTARTVRGRILELREEDFVIAARLAGASESRIILRHLIPSTASLLIVSITMSIPGMILGETALSFLGLGLRPPVVSWGVLLQQAQNFRTLVLHPWLLIPSFFVIITVVAFNFMGDGLRDAMDPYKY